MSRHARILLVSSYCWYLGEGMLGPLFAVFAMRVGGDVLAISWAWATYLVVTGVLVLAVGQVSDRWVGKTPLMLAGYVLNTLCTFGYLLVTSPWHLFVVQAGLGVAAALALPTWHALFTEAVGTKRLGTMWGLSGGGDRIVLGVAMLIGGAIVTAGSFTALFVTMGMVQVVATAYQARILRG